MKFGDNLKKLRKLQKISQEELAEQVGVSRQSVSKWELGDAYPTMNNILQICKIFHCHINDLVNDNIIDYNSLDDEIKMSVVKFKEEKQRKVKLLSKIIAVISKIGGIICKIAIPVIAILICALPVFINSVEIKNNTIISKNQKIKIIDNSSNLRMTYNGSIILNEDNVESIKTIKDVLSNNSKVTIIVLAESAFLFLIITFILIIIMLKHLENLFNNINKGDTPFTLDNVKHIKRIAYYMIALIIIPSVSATLFELLLNIDLNADFEMFDLLQILFLFSMAYIFEYGYEIQLDSKGRIYGEYE